jgi:hypothetical protein
MAMLYASLHFEALGGSLDRKRSPGVCGRRLGTPFTFEFKTSFARQT